MKSKLSRKLLTAKLGVGAVTIVACSAFPGCNLLPPPSRDTGPRIDAPEPDANADADSPGTDTGSTGADT